MHLGVVSISQGPGHREMEYTTPATAVQEPDLKGCRRLEYGEPLGRRPPAFSAQQQSKWCAPRQVDSS
ncbi:hypothetical protein DW089_11260 [Acidaminococcus sp. AM05-11]|mgnify:CR=1 FL=1|jgi:hypothetical protein|nr:hypothetical protein DW089_11260 [Acidaminococcus sp. AM05-11]